MKRFALALWRQLRLPETKWGWWELGLYLTAIGWCISSGYYSISPTRFFLGIAVLIVIFFLGLIVRFKPDNRPEDDRGFRFDKLADLVGWRKKPTEGLRSAQNRDKFEATAQAAADKAEHERRQHPN